MEKNINFIVKEDEKNLRVDVLINKREELISRTRIKNLIYFACGICLFYFAFLKARVKGTLINMGE